jgi:hypothetical protein
MSGVKLQKKWVGLLMAGGEVEDKVLPIQIQISIF